MATSSVNKMTTSTVVDQLYIQKIRQLESENQKLLARVSELEARANRDKLAIAGAQQRLLETEEALHASWKREKRGKREKEKALRASQKREKMEIGLSQGNEHQKEIVGEQGIMLREQREQFALLNQQLDQVKRLLLIRNDANNNTAAANPREIRTVKYMGAPTMGVAKAAVQEAVPNEKISARTTSTQTDQPKISATMIQASNPRVAAGVATPTDVPFDQAVDDTAKPEPTTDHASKQATLGTSAVVDKDKNATATNQHFNQRIHPLVVPQKSMIMLSQSPKQGRKSVAQGEGISKFVLKPESPKRHSMAGTLPSGALARQSVSLEEANNIRGSRTSWLEEEILEADTPTIQMPHSIRHLTTLSPKRPGRKSVAQGEGISQIVPKPEPPKRHSLGGGPLPSVRESVVSQALKENNIRASQMSWMEEEISESEMEEEEVTLERTKSADSQETSHISL